MNPENTQTTYTLVTSEFIFFIDEFAHYTTKPALKQVGEQVMMTEEDFKQKYFKTKIALGNDILNIDPNAGSEVSSHKDSFFIVDKNFSSENIREVFLSNF